MASETTIADYGSWKSPISGRMVANNPMIDGFDDFFQELRVDQAQPGEILGYPCLVWGFGLKWAGGGGRA